MGRFGSILAVVSTLWMAAASFGQSQGCSCRDYLSDKLRAADTIIHVNDQFHVAVCGYYNKRSGYVSEFTLYDCADPLSSIGEWQAHEGCFLSLTDSSLIVDEMATLPQGKRQELAIVPTVRSEIMKRRGQPVEIVSARLLVQLEKPTPEQVSRVQHELDSLRLRGCCMDERQVAHLFLCAVYDLNGWKARFYSLRDAYVLDGAVAEYYNELIVLFAGLPAADD